MRRNVEHYGPGLRAWAEGAGTPATEPLANFPATNNPNAAWYQTLLNRPDVVS